MKKVLRDYLGLIMVVVVGIIAVIVMYKSDEYYNTDQYNTPTQIIELNK